MHEVVLRESSATVLTLTPEQATALATAGKALVGSSTFWGAVDVGDDTDEKNNRTVVRCLLRPEGTYSVTVADAVGIIALPDLRLVVEPKVPLDHFTYLLARSPASPRTDDQDASAADAVTLWDLVAAWYVAALEQLLRRGLLNDYALEQDDLTEVRGSVLLTDTALGYYRGRSTISCEYEDFNPDTALNRVLLAAALAVAQAAFIDPALRRRARRCSARLEDAGHLRPIDLRAVLDRRTNHYRLPIALARNVLEATGRTVGGGSHHAQTFLIRTPELVEDAIRSVLRDGLAPTVKVAKRKHRLPGSALTLNPDLVFDDIATGDVKYKVIAKDWNRADLYQAVAFATGFGVDRAAIVAFSADAAVPATVQVGDVTVTRLAWDCSLSSAPDVAAQKVVADTATWLASAGPEPAGVAGASGTTRSGVDVVR